MAGRAQEAPLQRRPPAIPSHLERACHILSVVGIADGADGLDAAVHLAAGQGHGTRGARAEAARAAGTTDTAGTAGSIQAQACPRQQAHLNSSLVTKSCTTKCSPSVIPKSR